MKSKEQKLLSTLLKALGGKSIKQLQIDDQLTKEAERKEQQKKEFEQLQKHNLEVEQDRKRLASKRIKEIPFNELFKGKFPCGHCGNKHTNIGFCFYKGSFHVPAFAGFFIECSKCKMSTTHEPNKNFLNKYTVCAVPFNANVSNLSESEFKRLFDRMIDPLKRKKLAEKVKPIKIQI